MVFLSESIISTVETIDATVETIFTVTQFIDKHQPILDFIVSIMEILGCLSPIIVSVIWTMLISPHIKFKRFVNSVYTQENLREVLKYYIRTRAQDMDPCEQDEIKENNGKYISCNLISFFLKDAFFG